MSEFGQLIDLDFSQLSKAQFKRLLKLIMSETGKDRDTYLSIVQCKGIAYMVEILLRIEQNTGR